jgi:hypothetical protein
MESVVDVLCVGDREERAAAVLIFHQAPLPGAPGTSSGTQSMSVPVIARTQHFVGRNTFSDLGNETTKYLRLYNQALSASNVSTLYANA